MKIHHAFPISRPTMELRLNNRLRLTNTQELPIFLKRFATGKTAAWEHHWQQWAASLSVLTPVIINAVVLFLRHVKFLTNIGRMTLNFHIDMALCFLLICWFDLLHSPTRWAVDYHDSSVSKVLRLFCKEVSPFAKMRRWKATALLEHSALSTHLFVCNIHYCLWTHWTRLQAPTYPHD